MYVSFEFLSFFRFPVLNITYITVRSNIIINRNYRTEGLFHAQMSNDSSLFTSRALQSLPMRPVRSQHHVPNV